MSDTAPAVPVPQTAGPEALSQQPPPRPKALSLRRNFGWALTGNLIYQGSQWLNLVILAKLLDVAEVGQFALALAICTPITVFLALNLRSVQVTDARHQHQFGHFLAVQLVMSLLSILAIITVALLGNYDSQTRWIVIVVGLGQSVLVLRDVFIAFNQKHERMDLAAISNAMLGTLSLAALTFGVWSTGSLLIGVIGLQSAKLIVFLLWDLPATRNLSRQYLAGTQGDWINPRWEIVALLGLIWTALPLGISALFVSLNYNVPRYLIAGFLGEAELGYFAAIIALVMAGTLVTNAAGQAALPRLSQYYIGNRRAFVRLLWKLTLVGCGLGVLGLLAVVASGPSLLAFLFTSNYAAYQDVFVWSMVFGAMTYVITFWGYAMTGMRYFKVQPLIYIGSLITTFLAGWFLIPKYGLIGGIGCLIAGKVTQGIWTLGIVVRGLGAARTE